MPAVDRAIDLFLNVDRSAETALVRSKSDLGSASRPNWVAADKFVGRLHFVQPGATSGAVGTILTINEGDTIALSGKVAGSSEILFLATDWTEAGEAGDERYEGAVDLNTAELLAAIVAAGDSAILVTAEIEIRNAANTARVSYQFQVRISDQVYTAETPPPESLPDWPAPETVVTKAPVNGSYRVVSDGGTGLVLQLKNGGTGKFHTLFITGAAGAEALAIGPGVD